FEVRAEKSYLNKFERFLVEQEPHLEMTQEKKVIQIPVCSDISFGIDLEEVSKSKNITVEEIIQLHTARQYRVYMLGFLPGFPYMGIV
ncbi:carboxyltransferase domain-containing protein, partial [Acinetobacter baumannii]